MFKIIATLLAILATYLVSEYIFTPANLFYEVQWLDIPMHIWGGFLFALLFIFGWRYFRKGTKLPVSQILIFAFIIGLIWEGYEYINHLYFAKDWGGVVDSIKDMFDDMLGAIIAIVITKVKR